MKEHSKVLLGYQTCPIHGIVSRFYFDRETEKYYQVDSGFVIECTEQEMRDFFSKYKNNMSILTLTQVSNFPE